MKCYQCAKENKDRDAVAVCKECGMGICMEHAVERKPEPRTVGLEGFAGSTTMRILCPSCATVEGVTS